MKMTIAYDAKRALHNRRGLGNYSRDVIRLVRQFAPDCTVHLLDREGDVRPQGLWRWLPSLWRNMGCVSQVAGTDIYHGLSGQVPWGIRRSGAKVVVTMHDAIFVRYPHLYSPTYRWIFSKRVAYACRVADIIVCISEQTKRDMIEYFGADEAKIRVVYQGCSNIFRTSPDLPSREESPLLRRGVGEVPYILQVGAIEPRKNLMNTIEAVHRMGYTGAVVALGGRTTYADRCEARARELGVDLRIVSGEKFENFPAWYRGADLTVYPSVFEGFGIPILESMCCGVPVVTSTGSCFAETGGDAALYADPADADDLARCIDRMLHEEGLREEMIRRGYRQAEKFTDENVAKNLLKVYEELV